MLSGLFVGMVLGLQGFQLLERFGSQEALGTAATIGLVKELGPVVTALLFAGRAGTALTSGSHLLRWLFVPVVVIVLWAIFRARRRPAGT